MGLFDSYDPNTYQGSGGMIDRLLAQLGVQSQYQPSPGFPDAQPSPLDNAQWPAGPMGAPSQANAQMPAQNDPIAVGGYQMPRIGGGFPEETAPQAQAPMNAMAQMQPQVQQPQAVPGFLQPQHSPGGFGGAMRGAMANIHTGPLGMLGAGIAGAMGMGQGSAQEQQQRAVLQTYQSLIAAGVPEQKARLAAINPEYGKTIVADALGPQTLTPLGEGYVADKRGNVRRAYEPGDKNKLQKIGQDGLGREQYGVFNPSDGSIKPLPMTGGDTNGGGLGNMELSGKDYLASIPTAQRGTVQGMVDGTIAPPSSFALSKPYWQNMIAAAKNYDPTFDATNWSGRVDGIKDFSAGKSSEMVRSANQTLHHVGALIDSMDALNNGDYPLKNKIGNALDEATGSGTQGAFRSNAHAVATELSKVFKGSNLSDAEVKAWEQNLHENMSPEQQRTQIAKLGELLKGSLDALEEKRTNSIGPMAAEKQGPLIKAEGQRVLTRIKEWIDKGTGAAQGTTPAQTKTGVSWSVVQ